ncbi:DUF3021 family protein [Vagococcus elongatus]|uniref:Uncharacterized protein n=1 Tax=Vagococcus elongatus TaxID=180344 RepID=A0A430AQB5_9ENTE|nr:hypothetical protein CBF29_09930 [Vagococcus elongatus]
MVLPVFIVIYIIIWLNEYLKGKKSASEINKRLSKR